MEKESLLGHTIGETVIYSNPASEEAGKFQWDGKVYLLLAKGRRVERAIGSVVDAIIAARQLSKNGVNNKIGSWIEPCTKPEEGRLVHCPYKDPGQNLCRYGEPPIHHDGKIECPLQKGSLRFIEHLTDT